MGNREFTVSAGAIPYLRMLACIALGWGLSDLAVANSDQFERGKLVFEVTAAGSIGFYYLYEVLKNNGHKSMWGTIIPTLYFSTNAYLLLKAGGYTCLGRKRSGGGGGRKRG